MSFPEFCASSKSKLKVEDLRKILDQMGQILQQLKEAKLPLLKLKASNLYICPEELTLKLATFGLHKERQNVTIDQISVSSYMSLEQQMATIARELVPGAGLKRL